MSKAHAQARRASRDRRIDRQGGYVGLLAMLISVAVLAFVMYAYFEKSPGAEKSPMDVNRAALENVRDVQLRAEMNAKAANQAMEGIR
jgi:hypothetical protein